MPLDVLALTALLLAGAPEAAPSPAAVPPRYPVHVELALTPRAASRVYQHVLGSELFAPTNPSSSVPVGKQAREAYAATAARLFLLEPADDAARLEIDVTAADLDLDLDGWHASVEHALVLRSASGEELGRWVEKGRAPVEGLAQSAIPRAFRAAAEVAALRFEAAFGQPPGVARWLGEHGAAPAASPAPPPAELPLVLQRQAPTRTWALYVDAGGGSYGSTESRQGHEARTLIPALAARAGVATPGFFLQVSEARTAGGVDKRGVEIGPLIRIAPRLDLKVGGGVQWVDVPEARSASLGTALAALTLAVPTMRGNLWMRLGVEARVDFGASRQTFTEDRLGTYEAATGASGWLFIGVEQGPE